jgi:hypothetical protein
MEEDEDSEAKDDEYQPDNQMDGDETESEKEL